MCCRTTLPSAITVLNELATNTDANSRRDVLAVTLANRAIDWRVVDRHAQELLTLLELNLPRFSRAGMVGILSRD
jgi:hypothetical protein